MNTPAAPITKPIMTQRATNLFPLAPEMDETPLAPPTKVPVAVNARPNCFGFTWDGMMSVVPEPFRKCHSGTHEKLVAGRIGNRSYYTVKICSGLQPPMPDVVSLKNRTS